MNEWTKGYCFGCAMTLWLIWLAFSLSGCAHEPPYYSGTATQHLAGNP